MNPNPYRAAVVGCGRIGCAFDDDPRREYVSSHAGAYAVTPKLHLAALADLDLKKVHHYADRFNVPGRYTDFLEMLKKESPDVVSVCTWNYTHLDIVRAAVEQGVKAIFCEKPIADTLWAADEMIRLCKEPNVLLMIDHQRRFDPFHHEIKAFLKEGRLGRIQQVTCYYTAGTANTGTHLFDLLRFYLGDVSWVEGRCSQNPSPNPYDPNIDGWIGFKEGPVAAIQACDVSAFLIFEISLIGTQGRLRITSSGFDAQFEEVRESERYAGYRELFSTVLPLRNNQPHEVMLLGIAHLLECLENQKKPLSTGEDGRASLEIICALRESANSRGKRVELPLTDRSMIIQSR